MRAREVSTLCLSSRREEGRTGRRRSRSSRGANGGTFENLSLELKLDVHVSRRKERLWRRIVGCWRE